MNNTGHIVLLVMVFLLASGCSRGPKPIIYGTDACQFCRMSIIDPKYATEIVTHKGKVYKFDSVECLLHFGAEMGEEYISQFLGNTFDAPEELNDLTSATFLISESLPSPMGANLTAFRGSLAAQKAREEHGGSLYDWEVIHQYVLNNDRELN